MELFCAGCGGPLGPGAPDVRGRRRKDPFRGRTVGGARLTKLISVDPTRRVYRARHRGLRSHVRAEVFPEPFASENLAYVRHLLRQAALTSEINSLYVVTVLDLGRLADCYYILTECPPDCLRSLLRKAGRIDLNRVLALMEEVLQGLTAVEGAGAFHGNVTPEGVLLDYDGAARLDHLGTALRPQELNRLTVDEDGAVCSPALYIAPERALDGRLADIRSDLYSLGVTAYEMISGRAPHEGANAQEIMCRRMEEPAPRLSQRVPDVPAAMSHFVARLMAGDPAARPPTSQAALDELRECAVEMSRAHEIGPVRAAVPSGRTGGGGRWTALWWAAAFFLFALAVIPLALLYKQHRVREALAREAQEMAPLTVAVLIREADSAAADPLPRGMADGLLALLAHGLAFYPELQVIDPARTAELQAAGRDPRQVRDEVGANCLLVAEHAPGLERRRWTLVFATNRGEPWSVHAECAVAQDREGDAAPLADALGDLLASFAARLAWDPLPEGALETAGRSLDAWSAAAGAIRAERLGRWREAASSVERALATAPGTPAFQVLSAFYNAVQEAQERGTLSGAAGLPLAGLPPEMGGLSGALAAMAGGDPDGVEERFGEFLARSPGSGRGYFLMGLWRQHTAGRPEEAALSFRQAVRMDPGYLPAALACVELLAQRDAASARQFVQQYKETAPPRECVYRLTRRAEELLGGAVQ